MATASVRLTASLLGVVRLAGARGAALVGHVPGGVVWSVRRVDGRFDTWLVRPSLELTPLLSRTVAPVSALVTLPGGELALAVGARIVVFDHPSLTARRALRGHRRGGVIWALTPVSGDRLVSRSTDLTVVLWDLTKGRALQRLDAGACQGAEVGADPEDPEAVLLLTQPDAEDPGVLTLVDLHRGGRPRPPLRVGFDLAACAAALRPGGLELLPACTPRGGPTTTLSLWSRGEERRLCATPTRRAGVAALNEVLFPSADHGLALGARDSALVELGTGAIHHELRAYRVTSRGLALVDEAEVVDLRTAARLVFPSGALRAPRALGASSLAEDGASFALGAGDELVWWTIQRG